MYKSFLFLLVFITYFTNSFAQDTTLNKKTCPEGLYYKLVSYPDPSETRVGNTGRTPLFNLEIFNNPCFELGRANYQNGFQFVFDLAVGASVALAVILFTVGAAQGIFYAASSTDMKAGKDQMQKAVVGLLVVLSIWLVVNTVNPDLLRLPALQNIGNLPTRDSGTPGGGPGGVAGKSAGT